mmetsp:Transcript_50597/g.141692  ORF Transcript_50597/g.141692 Transcript_50597/m.141692 type:complete len:140 (-) Transcript_50597:322-741(-)
MMMSGAQVPPQQSYAQYGLPTQQSYAQYGVPQQQSYSPYGAQPMYQPGTTIHPPQRIQMGAPAQYPSPAPMPLQSAQSTVTYPTSSVTASGVFTEPAQTAEPVPTPSLAPTLEAVGTAATKASNKRSAKASKKKKSGCC